MFRAMQDSASPSPSRRIDESNRKTFWPSVAFAIILLSVVGYLSLDAISEIEAQRRASATFLPVEATVIAAEVDETRSSRGVGQPKTSRRYYKPIISYRYEVAGSQYQNATYRFPAFNMSRKLSQEIVNRYPLGSQIRVYYDPVNPAISVIDPSPPIFGTTILFMLAGFGIGLVILVTGIRGFVPNPAYTPR